MEQEQRGLWQKMKKPPIISLLIALCVGGIILIIPGYLLHWTWTGFDKTLWDWIQLLIIPVALAMGALLLNRSDQKREQEMAIDNQRETLLQSYLDRLSELLLEKNLRASQPDEEVRNVARARTLTVLSRLDAVRRRSVLDFLLDSGLISIIDMDYADFSGITADSYQSPPYINLKLAKVKFRYAHLTHFELENVNLKRTNFSWAKLSHIKAPHANLQSANLSHTHLSHLDLRCSDLTSADLRGARLCHVILSGTNLSRADLRGVTLNDIDLSNADLSGATLTNVDFRSVNLQGADLSGANLNGAKFRKEDTCLQRSSITELQKAHSFDSTVHHLHST